MTILLVISVTSPIHYHHICINNHTQLCFRDADYLCICEADHTRVECFRYDNSLDQCSYCRAGGLCLQGDRNQGNDFLCLCSPCHSGRFCQFNSDSFTFTLDQMLFTDLISNRKQTLAPLLILVSFLLCLLALPSNIFSFVTLRRQQCLRTGTGNYLLYMSVVNQINLALLASRLTHLTMNVGMAEYGLLTNDNLCKFFSYSLTCCARIAYWLASFVAIERVYTTLFFSGQWLKKPRIARRLILLICVVVLLSDLHELIFVRSFSYSEGEAVTICVIEFPTSHRLLWTLVHQVGTIFNASVPLFISIGSTVTIIWIITKKKMNIQFRNRCKLYCFVFIQS